MNKKRNKDKTFRILKIFSLLFPKRLIPRPEYAHRRGSSQLVAQRIVKSEKIVCQYFDMLKGKVSNRFESVSPNEKKDFNFDFL